MWRTVAVVAAFGGLVVGGSAAGRVHVVKPGETLEAIGRTYGVPVPALAAANGVRNPDLIAEGRTLAIPAVPLSLSARDGAHPAPALRPAAPVRVEKTPPTGGHKIPVTAAALRDTVVRMPPAQLAVARPAPPIVVPADRAGLRVAFLRLSRLAGIPSDLAMALAWQ